MRLRLFMSAGVIASLSEPSSANLHETATARRGVARHGGLIGLKELRNMMWNDGMTWTGWLSMGVLTVAFWVLVVFAVAALFRSARPGPGQGAGADLDAARILDQRFARGEIDADEYHSRQDVLRSGR